ncbi:U11/U12 small nuclear ribonucleoprotein [Homalodisca vitripennis]|nr:U11/U12 small nuclear ribonucleoprotein [Homalodisca vitripennis]
MDQLIQQIDEEGSTLEDNDEEYKTGLFTLKELIEITKTTLNEVIQKDSLLSDLPLDVTVEEVNAQIALEHGQSMTIFVVRADGEELPVVVSTRALLFKGDLIFCKVDISVYVIVITIYPSSLAI